MINRTFLITKRFDETKKSKSKRFVETKKVKIKEIWSQKEIKDKSQRFENIY